MVVVHVMLLDNSRSLPNAVGLGTKGQCPLQPHKRHLPAHSLLHDVNVSRTH